MSLPYRWTPTGTETHYGAPKAGWLIAFEHEVWRVIDVRTPARDLWSEEERRRYEMTRRRPTVVTLRHVDMDPEDPLAARFDIHLGDHGRAGWEVYPDEHYPVCARCGEPSPCREVMAARVAANAAQLMGRYLSEGMCPACEKAVTPRQESIRFDDNLELPGGPPVVFHLAGECTYWAREYEKRWAQLDPARRTRLSCPGEVTTHNDGTYECTNAAVCPGPAAQHAAYSRCRCPSCHDRGQFDCFPSPAARLSTPHLH